jgi:hypothetical protein
VKGLVDSVGTEEPVDYQRVMRAASTSLFLRDHPRPRKNVFLMMGFDSSPMRQEIESIVRNAGQGLGFDIIRADDVDYSGEIWGNVELCLENCRYGIAVFDTDSRNDQNLAVELGYLFARGTPCLILRDRALPPPATMLSHRVHSTFSSYDLRSSFQPKIERWLEAIADRSASRFRSFRRLRPES